MGFVLAATGSAIGLGNLWNFPFTTWANGGGAFVVVYLMCIAAVGLPIMMAELLIGRSTQKSAVGALKEAVGPAWGLVGLWGVLCGFTLLSYGVNVFVFVSGRLKLDQVAVVGVSDSPTDPLPQALVLTAIVIGFAMTAFLVVLALRGQGELKSDHVDGRRDEEID